MRNRHPATTWVSLAATAALAFGCVNGRVTSSTSNGTNSAYTASTDSNTSVPFTITQVVKDVNNPSTILDLVGDGSGAMGNYCPQTSVGSSGGTAAAASGSSTTPCNCILSYNYTNPQTGVTSVQQYDAYTTYTEANLIECNYSAIPAGVTSVNVEVQLVASNSLSNTVNVTLVGNYGSVDITNINNFSLANRWQCREVVTLTTISSTIYDPLQSDDPHIYYPLDFYATNFGWTLAQYAQASQQFVTNNTWSCPQNPEPSALANNPLYNMNVYSVADLAGVKLIYPPQAGQFDRSTFYLANVPSGAFTMPVNAFIAPTVVTSNTAPLGYGAPPVPAGNGTETCPTASMPAGYHWVKVWLFSANLQPRTYLQFSNSTLAPPSGFENIMCNPPALYPCDPTEQPSGTCSGDLATGGAYQCGASAPTLGTSLDSTLAARILGTGACITVNPGALNRTSASCTAQGTAPGASINGALGCGTDEWTALPANTTNPSDVITNCVPSATGDPFGLCSGSPATPVTQVAPSANAVIQNYDGNTSRSDYLFVVTPVSVNTSDMQGTLGQSYTPYRFIANSDCTAADPDTDPTCIASVAQHMIGYSLSLNDLTANTPAFPVCAIQPN